MRRAATVAAGAVLALLVMLGLAPAASAHAVLLSTTPATSSHVASAPAAVVLNFDEQPQGRYSTIHVLGPDGQRRDSGPVRVVDDSVTESLGGTRPAGHYVVDWRVISADGHPVSGQLSFTADAAASALAVRQAEAAPKTSGGSTGVVVIVVIAAALVIVIAFFLLRRRRQAQEQARSSVS